MNVTVIGEVESVLESTQKGVPLILKSHASELESPAVSFDLRTLEAAKAESELFLMNLRI